MTADQQLDEQMISHGTETAPSSGSQEAVAGGLGKGAHGATRGRWFLLPREHGAWGMVSLPFLAAAIIAPGNPFALRPAAALLAVFSVFLLRDPVVLLRRLRAEPVRTGTADQRSTAKRALTLCVAGLAISGTFLLMTLPPFWVLLLGISGLVLVLASVVIAVERVQREITSQIVSVVGLTASCLPAYLAVHGELDWLAAAIWALSAAHSLASVFVVRARLEGILSRRRSAPPHASGPFFRAAVGWQAGLWTALITGALLGYQWMAVPFLLPGALHARELWQCRYGTRLQISMHRVGWSQFAASVSFCCLLILVFRYQFLS